MEASKGRVLCYKNQPPPLTPPSGPSRQCWALLVGINTLSGLSPAETGRALEELARHDIVMQTESGWRFTVELMRRWVKRF